jgi:putative ABC transport system permease protein
LFASIPTVAMLVAALGVANLMMANVTSRTRQIAILRAVGATKWQIIRLVFGEALVLAVIGTGVGLALGFHAAYTVNLMTAKLWGFVPQWDVPWGTIGKAVAFTAGVCLLAGILPAHRASRSNIIEAMQAT